MTSHMKHKHLLTFGSVMLAAWVLGTFLLIYFWPHFVSNFYKKAILNQGGGEGDKTGDGVVLPFIGKWQPVGIDKWIVDFD